MHTKNAVTHSAALAAIDDLIRAADPGAPWEEDYAYSLGIQAYIWGFPWIYLSQLAWLWTSSAGKELAERTGKVTPSAPMNSFWYAPELAAPGKQSTGGSPNADTLYATAWLDLSREPLVLSVPAVTDRFYAIQLAGIDSDNFAYVGTVATGKAANNYLIAAPGWTGKVPADVIDLARSRTPVVFALGRTEVLGDDDVPTAQAIQQKYRLTPLSCWGNSNSPPPPPKAMLPIGFDYHDTTGAWLTMNEAMTYNPPGVPPGIEQQSLIALFATAGVGPGQQLGEQSEATLRGLQRGAADGLTLLQQASIGRGKQVNGWTYPPLDIGRAGQVGDYITRSAIQAMGGIVANDPNESVYLNASVDSAGAPLGAGHYEITFQKAEDLPPVISEYYGFWSITVYDAATHDFIDGSLSWTINSHDPKYQGRLPGGGLKILLQPQQPLKLPTGVYWLQTPGATSTTVPGGYYLVLRIYAPTPDVSDTQTWSPAAIVRVG